MIAAESTYPQPNAEQSVALEADAAALRGRRVADVAVVRPHNHLWVAEARLDA